MVLSTWLPLRGLEQVICARDIVRLRRDMSACEVPRTGVRIHDGLTGTTAPARVRQPDCVAKLMDHDRFSSTRIVIVRVLPIEHHVDCSGRVARRVAASVSNPEPVVCSATYCVCGHINLFGLTAGGWNEIYLTFCIPIVLRVDVDRNIRARKATRMTIGGGGDQSPQLLDTQAWAGTAVRPIKPMDEKVATNNLTVRDMTPPTMHHWLWDSAFQPRRTSARLGRFRDRVVTFEVRWAWGF